MSKAFFIKTLHGLGVDPSDERSREVLKGIPLGATVQVEVTRPRNLNHMRLYWALCGAIADGIGADRENISDVIKLRTGHFTVVQTKTERLKFPKSISFGKLTQAEFSEFFNRACMVVCEEFIPHMKATEMRKQIEQMVGIPVSEAA